jgi:hypothetical protein
MTNQPHNAMLSPLDLLARQSEAITSLTATIEFLQQEYESLRRRVQALEDARARRPEAEPPEPG